MARTAKGIRRTAHGWQVYARVKGRFVSEHFPPDTDLTVLKTARARLVARHAHGLIDPTTTATGPSFAADASDYLKLVTGMPSFVDRKYEIQQWAEAFKDQPRASITGRDIRRVLERWRLTGSAEHGPLSNGSLNRRRTALMSLYTTLDGRSAVNPVRDVPRYSERASELIRAQDPRVMYRVIARVGRTARGNADNVNLKGPSARLHPSKTRARLRLMLWTGWPQAQIMRLTPADINWKAETVRVSSRHKGQGTRPRIIPLFPGAVIALKAFVAAKAWGRFSTSGMHKSFQRAVAEENESRARRKLPPIDANPYSLRHTFGTELAKRLTDERAIQELMLHSDASQTRRYTEGATADRMVAAMAKVARLGIELQKGEKI